MLQLTWPTRRSPVLVKATTEGVVRPPSALVMMVGLPPSMAATALLVVPRSIPTTCQREAQAQQGKVQLQAKSLAANTRRSLAYAVQSCYCNQAGGAKPHGCRAAAAARSITFSARTFTAPARETPAARPAMGRPTTAEPRAALRLPREAPLFMEVCIVLEAKGN